jgi:TolB-like protein
MISQPPAVLPGPPIVRGIQGAAYATADAMIAQLLLSPGLLETKHPIMPTSFVDDDNFDHTTALGRLIPRQMASRFSQSGYQVTEIQLRQQMAVRNPDGTFMLSRELTELRTTQNVYAVLTGSYTVSRNHVHVTAQLIRLSDQRILVGRDFSLPLAAGARSLLQSSITRQETLAEELAQ